MNDLFLSLEIYFLLPEVYASALASDFRFDDEGGFLSFQSISILEFIEDEDVLGKQKGEGKESI